MAKSDTLPLRSPSSSERGESNRRFFPSNSCLQQHNFSELPPSFVKANPKPIDTTLKMLTYQLPRRKIARIPIVGGVTTRKAAQFGIGMRYGRSTLRRKERNQRRECVMVTKGRISRKGSRTKSRRIPSYRNIDSRSSPRECLNFTNAANSIKSATA